MVTCYSKEYLENYQEFIISGVARCFPISHWTDMESESEYSFSTGELENHLGPQVKQHKVKDASRPGGYSQRTTWAHGAICNQLKTVIAGRFKVLKEGDSQLYLSTRLSVSFW